jgi:PKD repeat protein
VATFGSIQLSPFGGDYGQNGYNYYPSSIIYNRATLSENGVVSSISVWFRNDSEETIGLQFGIYSDNGGTPQTLLCSTNFTNVLVSTTAQWYTLNLQTPTLLPSGTYWISYVFNNSIFGNLFTGVALYSSDLRFYDTNPTTRYSALPNPAEVDNIYTNGFGIYATYTLAPVAPTADFSATPLYGRVPLTVQFTDLSTESPTSWLWDFGDGSSSTEQNPTHVYRSGGAKTVVLTATNAVGSDSETKAGYINVVSPANSRFWYKP